MYYTPANGSTPDCMEETIQDQRSLVCRPCELTASHMLYCSNAQVIYLGFYSVCACVHVYVCAYVHACVCVCVTLYVKSLERTVDAQ